MVHRYILHGCSRRPGLQRWTHRLFDHLHVEHHERPWDGATSTARSGTPALPALPFLLALLLPPQTLLAFLAGFVQAYVVEEWVHHRALLPLRQPVLRYMKRHHLYHHSRRGQDIGSAHERHVDVVYGTRIPSDVRAASTPCPARNLPAPAGLTDRVATGADRSAPPG
jgi:sterol desaturase/sphingolipid hydroxylase (fatty acid hydroxylase superfamily)